MKNGFQLYLCEKYFSTLPLWKIDFNFTFKKHQTHLSKWVHTQTYISIWVQTVFALSHQCYVLSEEATNINFIVFGLTWQGFAPTIYHTRGEHTNHYTTGAAQPKALMGIITVTN
jgi:hypothetical protein